MSADINTLIAQQDGDIRQFRGWVKTLSGKPHTCSYIGDLERRIAMAERSKAILGAAR